MAGVVIVWGGTLLYDECQILARSAADLWVVRPAGDAVKLVYEDNAGIELGQTVDFQSLMLLGEPMGLLILPLSVVEIALSAGDPPTFIYRHSFVPPLVGNANHTPAERTRLNWPLAVRVVDFMEVLMFAHPLLGNEDKCRCASSIHWLLTWDHEFRDVGNDERERRRFSVLHEIDQCISTFPSLPAPWKEETLEIMWGIFGCASV